MPPASHRVPEPAEMPPGWHRPVPEEIPRPTYWPSVLAFGIVLVVWGPIASWAFTVVGLVVSVIALRGWIRELLREK